MNVENLKPNSKNPRTISPEKKAMLKRSLEEFGDLGGIVFNRLSGLLVGGHQRREAFDPKAKIVLERHYPKPTKTGTVAEGYIELKGERHKYREVKWDDIKEKAANIAANKGAGEWDLPELSTWLNEIGDFGFDLDLTMFDEKERLDFMGADSSSSEKDDEVPELPKKAKTKLGDVYALGDHRIMCGSSAELKDVKKLLGKEKPDFTITSPPYNVGLAYNSYDDSKSEKEYEKFLLAVIGNMKAICAENFWLLWNVGVYPLSLHLHLHLLHEHFKIRRSIAWVKTGVTGPPMMYQMQKNPVTKNYSPNFGWEIIACCHVNEKVLGKKRIPKQVLEEAMTDVWKIAQHASSGEQFKHPGAFPVALPTRAIQLYAEDVVYEPFSGSGSTLIACEKTNRRFYGMELDPLYCDLIVERWETYSGKKAKLLKSKD